VPPAALLLVAWLRARSTDPGVSGAGARGGCAGGGVASGGVSGVEGLSSVHLGVVVGGELLQEEEGPRGAEGVGWGLDGDDGLQGTILGVEAPKQIEHLA
jgi:hypothetical protein